MSVVFLGPRHDHPDLGGEVARLRGGSAVALVTAGWQEWEEDDLRLREVIGGSVVNLELYRRAETVWRHDPELAAAHSALQERVRLLRRAYNARLGHRMAAWIDLEAMEGDPSVLDAERASALDDVRALDRHHFERITALRAEFEHTLRPGEREIVARERHAVRGLLDGIGAVVIVGGHVPSLLNRLRLFDLASALEGRHVIGVSGGAMALADRVVLFHDSPPWGPGHAEVGEAGIGLVHGVVPLPDGRRRLRIDDPGRVSRMARRFAPDVCVVLDGAARAEWDGTRWSGSDGSRLADAGVVEPWRGVA